MVTVTTQASEELKKIMASLPEAEVPQGVRVYLSGRCGCGNAHYGLAFDDVREGDQVVEVQGVKVLLDPEVAPTVEGVEIDFVQDTFRQGFALKGLANTCQGHGHHAH